MSPVDPAGLVSEILPRHSFPYKNFEVFIDLGNQAGNFSHMNTPACILGLSVMKHFQLPMACKVANKSEHHSMGILGTFWTFLSW